MLKFMTAQVSKGSQPRWILQQELPPVEICAISVFFYFEMLICRWVLVAVLHLPATHFYEMKKTIETRTRARHLHSYTVLKNSLALKSKILKRNPIKRSKYFGIRLIKHMLITNMLPICSKVKFPLLCKMSHHLYWECEVSLL